MSAERNVTLIRSRGAIAPQHAVVLGSGLAGVAGALRDAISIPYGELAGFPVPKVSGHSGALVIGALSGTPVVALSGRGHFYEEGKSDVMRPALETLQALGIHTLVLTNAAGSAREDIRPGDVMLVADHINFGNRNPLIGEPGDSRFVGMSMAYDPGLRREALSAAEAEGIDLKEGVYMWFSGPSFETPAEIRAARILGADAVGMSTVPEVVLARFLGLRVLAFSVITNFAAGMTHGELSHEETKAVAPQGGEKLRRLLTRLFAEWRM